MPRDYTPLRNVLAPDASVSADARTATMRRFVDAAWPILHPTGLSWLGFYTKAPDAQDMILGPCRNKPACSPIGLHGVCGKAWHTRRSIIVHNVKTLGPNYVACDPKDQSELVIPLFDRGHCYGVLDADSFDQHAFSEHDAAELQQLLLAAKLTEPGRQAGGTITL